MARKCVEGRRRLAALGGALCAGTVGLPAAAWAQSLDDLRGLSLEQLGNIEVTSVLKRPEPVSEAPAAIFVITADDIRRSGAISLPEALRLAPNLEVARDNAQTYAVSARGFNSTDASNKMLVLIDGRAVYAPLASGVYWDQMNVPLDDIERIEVISGPGGSLWGANAFSGVINIITKSSADTQGGLVDLKAGNVDQNGLSQYGGRFGDSGAYRVYGMGFGIGHSDLAGQDARDADWGGQGGFRTDWTHGDDQVMTEGDFYRNANAMDGLNFGDDLLARWTHQLSDTSSVQLQTSYDRQVRLTPGTRDAYESYDLQGQQTIRLGNHTIVWGAEARVVPDDLQNSANTFTLVHPSETLTTINGFAQDTWALTNRLKLTYGAKVEYDSYTGTTPLPSIRLGWSVTDTTFLWAGISRAVRTPSHLDRELTATLILAPNPNFDSETLTAYEIGYRGRPTEKTSLSVTLYYNTYNDLRTTSLSQTGGYIYQLRNGDAGNGYGMESWADWQMLPWWRLSAGLTLLHKNLHLKPGILDVGLGVSEGFDPNYQVSLRSSMTLAHNVEFDVMARALDHLTNAPVSGYIDGSARLGWHATDRLEVSLSGYNLFSGRHIETVTSGDPLYEPRRSIYLGLRWTY